MWRPTALLRSETSRPSVTAIDASRLDAIVDPRRLPDQLRQQRARDPREVARLAHPRAARRRRDRRARASCCTPARARASRTGPSMQAGREGDREALGDSESCPVLLENTAGTQGPLGRNFDELAELVDAARRRRAGRDLPRLLPPARLRLRDPHRGRAHRGGRRVRRQGRARPAALPARQRLEGPARRQPRPPRERRRGRDRRRRASRPSSPSRGSRSCRPCSRPRAPTGRAPTSPRSTTRAGCATRPRRESLRSLPRELCGGRRRGCPRGPRRCSRRTRVDAAMRRAVALVAGSTRNWH